MNVLDRSFVESLPVGVFATDPEGACIYVNKKWQEITGLSMAQARGQGWAQALYPQDRDPVFREWQAAIAEDRDFSLEYRFQRHSGGVVWVYGQSSARRDELGNVIAYVGTITDITQQKNAEQKVRESNALLERIFANKHALIAYMDRDCNFLRVNAAYAEIDSRSPEFYVGKNHFDLFPNEENAAIFQYVIANGEPHFAYAKAFEYEHNPERGATFWDWGLWPVQDGGGVVTGLVLVLVDVSRRVIAESALQRERNLIEAMLQTANALIIVQDAQGRITRFNKACEEITFFTATEVMGKLPWELLLPVDQVVRARSSFERMISSREPYQFTGHWVAKDRTRRLIRWSCSVLLDDDESVSHVVSIGIDITENQMTQEHLLHNKARFEAVFNAIPDAAVFTDVERKIVAVNPAAKAAFGYSGAEMRGRATAFLYANQEDYQEKGKLNFSPEAKLQGKHYEVKYRRNNGDEFWGDTLGTAVFDDHRNLLGCVGIIRDVTEQRRAKFQLQESEQRFRQLTENLEEAFWMVAVASGEFIYVSPGFEKIWGRSCSILYVDRNQWFEAVHLADRERVVRAFAEQAERGEFNEEYRIVRPDGEIRWVWDRGFAITDENGKVYRIAGIAEDVTESRNTKEALTRFKTTLDLTHDCVFMFDPEDLRFFYVNQGAMEQVGYSYEEMMQLTPVDLKPEYDEQSFRRFIQPMIDGRCAMRYFETLHRTRDGVDLPVEIMLQYVSSPDQPPRFVAIVRDISERKKVERELARHRERLELLVGERTRELELAQEQLVRQERLATLGQLTATVSHELRNPLGAIKSSLYLVKKKINGHQDDRVEDALQRLDRNVSRCDHIIDELLDFTRITVLDVEFLPINDWLQEVIREAAIPEAMTVEVNLDKELGEISFDPSRLRRAVINIIDNACQALLVNGSVDHYRTDGRVMISTHMLPDRMEIEVRDNGPGIAPPVVARMFEPLFSTKGFGVGLGMPTVKQIMEQHQGGVEVVSHPGRGVCVTLWLLRTPLNPRVAATVGL